MLLAHRDQLVRALNQILEIVDDPDVEESAEAALTQIGNIAEAALKL